MRTLFLLTLFALSFAPSAHAFDYCRCKYEWTPAESWERSGRVFAGKVVEVKDYGTKKLRVYFDVSKSWRGPAEQSIRLFTDRADTYGMLKYGISCGYPFERGKEYLVYAFYEKHSPLTADKCTRTRPLSEAGEDLIALGEPDVTFTPEGPRYRNPPTPAGVSYEPLSPAE